MNTFLNCTIHHKGIINVSNLLFKEIVSILQSVRHPDIHKFFYFSHVTSTSDIQAFCIISASLSPQGIKRLICLTRTHAKKVSLSTQKSQNSYFLLLFF